MFDESNLPIDIPDEIEDDIDNDFNIPLPGLPEEEEWANSDILYNSPKKIYILI